MEATGGGIAVVSLSFQVLQYVNAIKKFVQDFKHAPEEITRLNETLENLSALLGDVHEILRLQLSSQGPYVPGPSIPIYYSLKSCHSRVQLLKALVDKHTITNQGSNSKGSKLWNNIKVGLKAKEIGEIEDSIQREITKLSTALILNSNMLQLQFFPAIISNRQAVASQRIHNTLDYIPISDSVSPNISNHSRTVSQSYTRTIHFPSYLQCLGVGRHKTLHILRNNGNSDPQYNEKDGLILAEENVFTWASTLLGYGIRWSRNKPYGNILPSLAIYPIVSSFSNKTLIFLRWATLRKIQYTLCTGRLHPFTKDTKYGFTLLHVAAHYHRADVCQLLLELGVKPELSLMGCSPLGIALGSPNSSLDAQLSIDTFRLLSHNTNSMRALQWGAPVYPLWPLGLIEWLWTEQSNFLDQDDRVFCQRACLQNCLISFCFRRDEERVKALLRKFVTIDVFHQCQAKHFPFLNDIILYALTEEESFEIGEVWIDCLRHIRVDVDAYMENLFKERPYGLLTDKTTWVPRRRIVANYAPWRGWVLGWEWVYDEDEPGFSVVSEFNSVAADTICAETWPFNLRDHLASFIDNERISLKWMKRLGRRMEIKARKELNRSLQRKPRNNMPGTWVD